MAQIQGTVISVALETKAKKQDGGTYDAWELVYKTDRGEIRSFQKPIQGLKFNPKLREGLASLQSGDEFTAVTDKNAGGFVEVKSIEKGFVVGESAPTAPPREAKATNNFQGRDFESKEERTKKQDFIIRQSSLASAVNILSIGAKTPPKVEEVLDIAERLAAFVYGAQQKAVAEPSLEDDIPY